MSVRWLIATAVVLLIFGVSWTVAGAVYDLDNRTSLEIAAVAAVAVGLPMSWWSFRGQLLDEPAEVAWVTWRRVPAAPDLSLGRGSDETRLAAAFGAGRPTTVVITGPPGVGKSCLAAGYARARLAEGWPMVAWVDAGAPDEMLAGLLEFADALSLRVPEEDSSRACERLRQHPPAGTRPSLIVFDGVSDVDAIRPYLPSGDGWRVLVTSNAPGAGRLGTEVALEPLSVTEGVQLTGLPAAVAEELGGLPAALAVAAATVRERRSDQPYPHRLRAVADLLGDGAGGPVDAAILLALAGVGFDDDRAVRRIMGLLTVLSPGGMSRAMLHTAEEPAEIDAVVDRLGRWRLLSTRMDGDGLFLHEQTRRVLGERLRVERALPAAVTDAAELLGRATFGDDQAWDRRGEGDQLVAHVAALTAVAGSVAESLPAEASERILGLRHWAARHLGAVGDGHRAVGMATSTRAECETLLGPEHADTLHAADNLVIALAAAGRAVEGIGLAGDTLTSRERTLGAAHPDTLASRYTLAYVHEYAGRVDAAAGLYESAFGEYSRVYGPDHPQTATVGAALARARALGPAPSRVRDRPATGPR